MIHPEDQATIEDFRQRILFGQPEPYTITPGSPWPSELCAIVATARRQCVDVMVEGGTYLGQSASVFASILHRLVDTVEISPEIADRARARLHGLDNVTVHVGDGMTLVRSLVQMHCQMSRRVGVFLDGPKGTSALVLVQSLMEDSALHMLRFIAVHDTYASRPERPNPIRNALAELADFTRGWTRWTTDDPAWHDVHALDNDLYAQHRGDSPHGWMPYAQYVHGERFASSSYGPTVTILERMQ